MVSLAGFEGRYDNHPPLEEPAGGHHI